MIVAGFASEHELVRAVRRLLEAGIPAETYTPYALPEGATPTPTAARLLPLLILIGGVVGTVAGFGLQVYGFMVSWPLDIGGRPNFFWTSYAVNGIEGGILCAVATGFLGFLIANRMPHLYDPVDEFDALRAASRDGWLAVVYPPDLDALRRAERILDEANPVLVRGRP